jgi:hypothetical protein
MSGETLAEARVGTWNADLAPASPEDIVNRIVNQQGHLA